MTTKKHEKTTRRVLVQLVNLDELTLRRKVSGPVNQVDTSLLWLDAKTSQVTK